MLCDDWPNYRTIPSQLALFNNTVFCKQGASFDLVGMQQLGLAYYFNLR